MTDFVALTCPSCGGKLQISNDIDRFACANCGNEHIVNRSGGVISLSPVVNELERINTSVGSTAAELAIVRIEKEINNLQMEINEIVKSKTGYAQKSCFWVVLLIFFIILAAILFFTDQRTPSFFLLLFIPLLIYLIWTTNKEDDRLIKMKDDEIKNLEADISKSIQEREDLISSLKFK